MSNEFLGASEGLDIGGAPREDINKVTEEAVRRIQEEAKKGQQAHQQSQQDKKTNNNLALFLTFLLKNLKDEKTIQILYELFFKTKHPATGTTYLRKKINNIVIIGFFYPFYQKESKEFGISPLFESLFGQEPLNLTGYINYIKKLSGTYHDNIPLDQDLLINFLISIISYYQLYNLPLDDQEQIQNFSLHIKNQLYS